MKKALFAGFLMFTTLIAPVPAYYVPSVEESSDQESLETSLILQTKVQELLKTTEEQLIEFQELYEMSYQTTMRLTAKHVTFSSRVALNEFQLLYQSREVHKKVRDYVHFDLLTPSMVTAYELDTFLSHTAMSGLGEAFVTAELETGVNALFLTALAIQESGWGKSKIAQNKHNLFGYQAYDKDTYVSAVSFSSKKEGILFVANKIRQNYLETTGVYFASPTLYGMNIRYSSDQQWKYKIGAIIRSIDEQIILSQDLSYEVSNESTDK